MIVAIISFIALAASLVLGVRAIKSILSEKGAGLSGGTDAVESDHLDADAGEPDHADTTEGTDAETSPSAGGASLPPYLKSGIVWGIVFCGIQLFFGVWSLLGFMQQDPISAIISNAVITFCAWASFSRPRITERVLGLFGPDGKHPHPTRAAVAALFVAGVFATLALEIPSNHNLLWMYPLCLLLEYALITAALVGAYFLFQRHGVAPAVVVVALSVLGIAEYFIVLFKSMPIQPGDIFALSTAMAVSAGYVYTLSSFCLYGVAFASLAMLACSVATVLRPAREAKSRKRVLVNLLVGILCIAGITCHVTLIDYYNTLGIQIYTWRPLESFYRQGYLPSFISSAQTIIPPKPDDYDANEAEQLLEDYAAQYDETLGADPNRVAAEAQFDEERPTVIAVMNETFSDLSIYQNLHAGYEGPEYFKSIPDALARGVLYVSAFGGGTCNTEFEFLTGNSMAYLGNGVYPYTIYNLSQTENLAQQFKDLGYSTTAIHPNHGTNWNRENVYGDFGFDEFLTIEDYRDAETLRGMVTDRATYDSIVDMLEENEDPQFIFDVTMQNHSGYDTGLIPMDMRTHYYIDGMYDSEANEYLALIEESDRALEEFLEELRKLDRKVVVVFFGDHQPYFPSDYNDEWFINESPAAHAERLWQTNYVIWANYDVAGNDQTSEREDISVNFLGSYLMQLIGAPVTDYQKAQLVVREAMPAINTTGFVDRKSVWYLTGTDEDEISGSDGDDALKARTDLERMQYLKLFDHGGGIFTLNLQDAANETDPNLAPGTTKIK